MADNTAELKKCLGDMKASHEGLLKALATDELERRTVQAQMGELQKRLADLNDAIKKKESAGSEYKKAIAEAEAALSKIQESTTVLLGVLKKETAEIAQRIGS